MLPRSPGSAELDARTARLAGGRAQVWRASASQRTRCEWSTTLTWAVSARPRGSARHPRPHARRTPRAAHEPCPACTGPIQNALLSRFAAPRRPQTGCLAVRKLSTGCLDGGYIRHPANHGPPPTRRAHTHPHTRPPTHAHADAHAAHAALTARAARRVAARAPRRRSDRLSGGLSTGCLAIGWPTTRHPEVSETGCLLWCAAIAPLPLLPWPQCRARRARRSPRRRACAQTAVRQAVRRAVWQTAGRPRVTRRCLRRAVCCDAPLPLLPWPHCPRVLRGRRTHPAPARLDSLRTGCPGCHVAGWRCPDSPSDSPSDSFSDSRHADMITVAASLSQARRARAVPRCAGAGTRR